VARTAVTAAGSKKRNNVSVDAKASLVCAPANKGKKRARKRKEWRMACFNFATQEAEQRTPPLHAVFASFPA